MAKSSFTKFAYKALQGGRSLAGFAHKELSTKVMELIAPEVMPSLEKETPALMKDIQESISTLIELDWKDAEKDIYPKSLLFKAPWIEWASKYPLIWLDLPSTWKRRKNKKTREIPKKVIKDIYPDYYLQNFHHQTDGYLSDYSASLYDLQVEILFNGTADSMRRRILSPLKEGLEHFKDRKKESLRILDVATGTGSTLKQLRGAFPKSELLGLDLSDAYLRLASKTLNKSQKTLVQLIRGNAENLPFADESMQAITCVFLLHELPPKARQNVLNDFYRVIENNGTLVLADSIQVNDSPNFISLMENFQRNFHEPYYKNYIEDDIDKRLEDSGFKILEARSHFMTRVWYARKLRN